MISSKIFLEKLHSIRYNQAPYQIQVICELVKCYNLEADKEFIANKLFFRNSKLKRSLTHWRSSCPVWGVLEDKNIITFKESTNNPLTVKLNVNLNDAEKKEVMEFCKEALRN